MQVKIKERKSCTQSEINEWLLKYSKKKKKVLRLKGGDVSFFSRVSQEINFLKKIKLKLNIFWNYLFSGFFKKSRI